jgi:hypothetical protein
MAVNQELLSLATFCTGSGRTSGTGSGSGSAIGTRTMIGFDAVGLKALCEAITGRGMGMGIGEADVAVIMRVAAPRRRLVECIVMEAG